MKFTKLTLLTLTLTCAFSTFATQDKYFEFKEVESTLEEITDPIMVTMAHENALTQNFDLNNELDDVTVSIDKIIMLGKKIWDIIVKNKPVVNTKTDIAHIVPQGTSEWTDLHGWDMPKTYRAASTFKNGFGTTVVDLSFLVTFSPNGKFDDQGHYIANLTILSETVDVLWGYNVDATANINKALNIGTKKDPIAATQVDINWKVKTVLKHSEKTLSLFVDGNGLTKRLSRK